MPGGIATARFGARATAIAGLLTIAVTTFVFATGDSIVVLDVSRFVQGFGSALAWTAGLAWLVGETPAERRGQTIGTAMAAAIVGALFGPVLGGIASVVGQAAAFGAAGLIAVGLAVWAALTHAPPPTSPQPLSSPGPRCAEPAVALSIWFVVLPALLFGTLGVLAPLRLEELGFTAVAIGLSGSAPPASRQSSTHSSVVSRTGSAASGRCAHPSSCPPSWPHCCPGPTGAGCLPPWLLPAASPSAASGRPRWRSSRTRRRPAGSGTGTRFALISLAWAPGQALGSSGGGALAEVTSDAVPYLLLSGACLITFVMLWPSRSSS